MLAKSTITLIFTSLGIIFVEPQAFQVIPSNTCVPCGGSTEFNCTTTVPINLGGGNVVEGVGEQLWRIQNPNGTVTNLSSNMPGMVPAGYEFISPFLDVYTGLRVLNTNSTWNGTTFQCIAFDPSNVERQNNSAAAVTLEVGGLPQSFSCELWCPDTYHPGTSDRCTIMWERLPTVSCDSLQFSVSLKQSDGTLVYSDGFGQSVSSTETTPLNQNTMYTVTIAAENACGLSTCTATNSTAIEAPATFNVTARLVFPSVTLEQINITWTPPGPGDPLVKSYTVNVSSTDGQQLCGSQTTGGNATSVVLDVTGCVMCQGANKTYAVAVEASNRGGQTIATTSMSVSYIQGYQVRNVSAGGQCALIISCTVSDRTVATGCVFMYNSNGDGTLESETLINLPSMGNTAEGLIIIDCNLNQLNFTLRAVAGTTLSTAIPLECPVSYPSFDLVSGRVSSGAPVRLQGIAINSTAIELQWEPPPLSNQNGVIHSYLITISVAETGSFYQLTSDSTTLNISGLHPFYTYNLTVAAVLFHPGPYSAVLTIQMPEDVPSSAPVHLQGIAVNSTSILLHWEPPPLADQNGVIHSFLITIIVTDTGSFFQLHSEMNTLNILTLHPYYTYILTVAAVTIGPGPYGEAVTIHMPEDVPSSPPVDLQGIAVSSTTIQLQWQPPPSTDQNGVIHSYFVNISVAETGSFFQLISETSAVNISALHPYYTYSMTVAAVTIGPGPYGAALTIQMPEDGGQSTAQTVALSMFGAIGWVLLVVLITLICYRHKANRKKFNGLSSVYTPISSEPTDDAEQNIHEDPFVSTPEKCLHPEDLDTKHSELSSL